MLLSDLLLMCHLELIVALQFLLSVASLEIQLYLDEADISLNLLLLLISGFLFPVSLELCLALPPFLGL